MNTTLRMKPRVGLSPFVKRWGPVIGMLLCFGAVGIAPDADASVCKDVRRLDSDQIITLVKAYQAGAGEGLGLTLAAVAWQESLAGKVKVNFADPSYGVFHANLNTAASREGVTGNYRKNLLAQRLLDDFDFAAEHALKELRYWKDRHAGDWRLIWASYNGGNSWDSPRAKNYADRIRDKITQIRKCLITV